jgi:hypothetical protein
MYRVTLEALLCVLDFDLPDEMIPAILAEQYQRLSGSYPD